MICPQQVVFEVAGGGCSATQRCVLELLRTDNTVCCKDNS